ncbi:unnamed protein product, partial [Rotaria sp. Silwood1]
TYKKHSYCILGRTIRVAKPAGHVPLRTGANPNKGPEPNGKGKSDIVYTLGERVLTGPTPVNIIYYGDWSPEDQAVINTFIHNIGQSSWFNIQKTYYYQQDADSPQIFTEGPLGLGGIYVDNYSLGKTLNPGMVPQIVQNAIQNGNVQDYADSIYLVLGSGDVSESYDDSNSFCKPYCGYHQYFTMNDKNYVYAYAGNPTTNCPSCIPTQNRRVSPSGQIAADGMLTSIAHEIAEAMSDPETQTWRDKQGNENADKW